MALQRQASGSLISGMPASSNGDHEVLGSQRPSIGHSRMYDGGRNDRGGLRTSNLNKPSRLSKGKRTSHSWRFLPCSVACVLGVCLFGLVASIFSSQFLMGELTFFFPRTFCGSFFAVRMKAGFELII